MNRIGIIAGSGLLPILTAREARRRGLAVVTAAIEGEATREMEGLSDSLQWVNVGKLGGLLEFFKRECVREAVFAGKIEKGRLLAGRVRPDWEMIKVVARLVNREDHALLESIAKRIQQAGVRLLEQQAFLPPACSRRGVWTRSKPSKAERKDISYGLRIARESARLDIGQTVVVKNTSVVAVESIEGTDETIRRAGRLAGSGAVVVKVARPHQDFRFDVPAVGLETVRSCAEARARVLVFEHGRTLVLEPEKLIELADKHRLCVVSEAP